MGLSEKDFTVIAACDDWLLHQYSYFYSGELEKIFNGQLITTLHSIESQGGSQGQVVLALLDAVKEVVVLH